MVTTYEVWIKYRGDRSMARFVRNSQEEALELARSLSSLPACEGGRIEKVISETVATF
jgi:hypothetical protein